MNRKLCFVVTLAAAVAGCSSSPPSAPAVESALPTNQPTVAVAAPVSSGETDTRKLERLIKPLANRSVYFDYDDFTVKPPYADTVKAHGEVLNSVDKPTVVIEGNADERGSTEYNLALGQKRAEAVGRAMRVLGIPDSRIEVISFGEE